MAWKDIKAKSEEKMKTMKGGSLAIFYAIMAFMQFVYQIYIILKGGKDDSNVTPPVNQPNRPLFPDSEPQPTPVPPAPRAHKLKDLIDRIRNR